MTTIKRRLYELVGTEKFTVADAAARLGLTEKQVRGAIDHFRRQYVGYGYGLDVESITDKIYQFVSHAYKSRRRPPWMLHDPLRSGVHIYTFYVNPKKKHTWDMVISLKDVVDEIDDILNFQWRTNEVGSQIVLIGPNNLVYAFITKYASKWITVYNFPCLKIGEDEPDFQKNNPGTEVLVDETKLVYDRLCDFLWGIAANEPITL